MPQHLGRPRAQAFSSRHPVSRNMPGLLGTSFSTAASRSQLRKQSKESLTRFVKALRPYPQPAARHPSEDVDDVGFLFTLYWWYKLAFVALCGSPFSSFCF